MKNKFSHGDPKKVVNIYTGDKTWIYAYDPAKKQQSMHWVVPNGLPPTKVC